MIGETIKGFKIIRRLGGGGMGEVWAAEQEMIRTPVAIKLLRAEISTDRQHVQRFFNEAVAVGKIKHAGIVRIFDVGFHAGRAFLIMELLEGETLAARLARAGRLSIAEVTDIGRQIASILEATHAADIIHRDLKPDNVFLTPDAELASKERVKVLDFGVAKLGAGMTTTGHSMGTPAYMAPELWTDAAKADGRADVYALGCVVFELCRGRPPFEAAWFGEAYAKHMNERPPPAETGAPVLDALIGRMLAKSPADRPSVGELGAAFTRIAADPARAREEGAPRASTAKRGRLGMLAGTVAGGLALAGGVVYVATRGDEAGTTAAPQQVAEAPSRAEVAPQEPPPAAPPARLPSDEPPRADEPPRSDEPPRVDEPPRADEPPPADEAPRSGSAREQPTATTAAALTAAPRPGRTPARRPVPAADERDPAVLLRQGRSHEQRGDWTAARKTYQRLERISGYAGRALYLQGRVALQAGDVDAALALAARSAAHPGPHKIEAKFLYGDALYREGEFRRAKDFYLGMYRTLTGLTKAAAERKVRAANRALKVPEDDGLSR